MKNKKGFTLIELLAVIVILGVLIGIAIPQVSHYISNSKKDGFVSSAKFFIDGARGDATSEMFPLPINANDVTIINLDALKLEKDQKKSSFGGNFIYSKSYVAIVNIGTGVDPEYSYYFAAQDSKNYAIPLTVEYELDSDDVIANAKNKMEVTVQSLCGSSEGTKTTLANISGLEEVQPVDANGNKLSWNATIFSGNGCGNNVE